MTVNEMMEYLRILQARGAGESLITFIQWNDEHSKQIIDVIESLACDFNENGQAGPVRLFGGLKLEKA